VPPRIINAQAIRAILLATAMMTTFGGRRFCNASIQASPVAARALAKRTALPAPMPSWQQLPETPRTTATSLMVRLLVEHTGSDLRSGSIGGRDDS